VPGYLEEPDVPGDSGTETFVALRLEVETWRWSGVPFFLRVGKRLPRRATGIAIVFRRPPLALFRETGCDVLEPNVLDLRIQPDEGISLSFGSKAPGQAIAVDPVRMDFHYATSFGEDAPEAYERLLLDAAVGDGTLFARRDEVELGWALVDAVRAGWTEAGPPLASYEAGTWGPPEADALMEAEGRRWRRP
jgi:glucose-6-phosphate 1-dehydrogenase